MPGTAAQFTLDHNNTVAHHATPQRIVHVHSRTCVTAAGTARPVLAACHGDASDADSKADQLWVFDSSGRFTNHNGVLAV